MLRQLEMKMRGSVGKEAMRLTGKMQGCRSNQSVKRGANAAACCVSYCYSS